jgi:hypothetical protein
MKYFIVVLFKVLLKKSTIITSSSKILLEFTSCFLSNFILIECGEWLLPVYITKPSKVMKKYKKISL